MNSLMRYLQGNRSPVPWLHREKGVSWRVALVYFLVGGVWIYSEHNFLGGPTTFKDFLFLIASACLLYFLVNSGTETIRNRERKIRETEELLRSILACDPSGVLLIDREGRFTYANPAALKMLGLEAEELIGKDYKDLPLKVTTLEGNPMPREQRPVYRALRGKEFLTDIELGFTRRDGVALVLSVNTAPLLGPYSEAEGVVASFIDVTQRKIAHESTLRESRERYFDLVETVNDLVWETDPNLVVTYLNPRIQDVLGFEPREVLGKSVFAFFTPEEANRIRKMVEMVRGRWKSFERIEAALVHRDGRTISLEVSGSPYFHDGGEFQGWRGVARDISQRKKAEAMIREKEEHFRQMFEQNEEPIILFKPGTAEVLDANPAAVGLYGYSREELLEQGLSRVVDRSRYKLLADDIAGVDAERKLARDGLEHLRKDGSRIIVSVRGASIWTISGARFTYCSFRDVTARVEAEEEAKSRLAQLIHSDRMASIGKTMTGIAHELNNPNNLIMFNAPMILQAWRDAEKILEEYRRERGEFPLGGLPFSEMRDAVPRMLHGISDSSLRIRNLVESLKNFSRVEPRELDCVVSLREIVENSATILGHEIRKMCDRFQVDELPDSLVVRGCRAELEQVLINLIHNSLQALPERNRAIRISASPVNGGNDVEIVVRDEGAGMPQEVLEKITKPFFSTKQDAGGLGLGLSISRSIVERHGGTLHFESEVGQGTTARILLPGQASLAGSVRKSIPGRSR